MQRPTEVTPETLVPLVRETSYVQGSAWQGPWVEILGCSLPDPPSTTNPRYSLSRGVHSSSKQYPVSGGVIAGQKDEGVSGMVRELFADTGCWGKGVGKGLEGLDPEGGDSHGRCSWGEAAGGGFGSL